MPYSIPADMARQLLYIGDVIKGPWDKRAVMGEAGGRIPVEGPMGGGGRVIQMPSRAAQGHEAEIARRIAERQQQRGVTPDQAAYEAALARQRPYSPEMQRSIDAANRAARYPEELSNIVRPVPPHTPANTAQTSFGRPNAETLALRDKMEMARFGRLLSDQERATLNRPGWDQP